MIYCGRSLAGNAQMQKGDVEWFPASREGAKLGGIF